MTKFIQENLAKFILYLFILTFIFLKFMDYFQVREKQRKV